MTQMKFVLLSLLLLLPSPVRDQVPPNVERPQPETAPAVAAVAAVEIVEVGIEVEALQVAPRPMDTPEPPVAPKGDGPLAFDVIPKTPIEGDLVVIRVKAAAKKADWILPKVQTVKDGAIVLADCPVKVDPNEAGLKLVLAAPRLPAGVKSQQFQFVAVADGAIGSVIVEVAAANPAPAPLPGPGPNIPPAPPADAFAADLQKLFAAETHADKKQQARDLAEIYALAANEAKDKTNATFAELLSLISAAIDGAKGLGPDVLKPVRERVKAELKNAVPNLAAELTDDKRNAAAGIYERAGKALEAVK